VYSPLKHGRIGATGAGGGATVPVPLVVVAVSLPFVVGSVIGFVGCCDGLSVFTVVVVVVERQGVWGVPAGSIMLSSAVDTVGSFRIVWGEFRDVDMINLIQLLFLVCVCVCFSVIQL